jgi:hypothetical protein
VGAACLLVPILRQGPAAIAHRASLFWRADADTESGLTELRWARRGLGLLVVGFALQIVGTWVRQGCTP